MQNFCGRCEVFDFVTQNFDAPVERSFVDGVDERRLPAAADLGRFVLERIAAGEPLPGDREWPEDSSDGSGAPTASLLASLVSQGRWLLPALPLYLRRPDAVPA